MQPAPSKPGSEHAQHSHQAPQKADNGFTKRTPVRPKKHQSTETDYMEVFQGVTPMDFPS